MRDRLSPLFPLLDKPSIICDFSSATGIRDSVVCCTGKTVAQNLFFVVAGVESLLQENPSLDRIHRRRRRPAQNLLIHEGQWQISLFFVVARAESLLQEKPSIANKFRIFFLFDILKIVIMGLRKKNLIIIVGIIAAQKIHRHPLLYLSKTVSSKIQKISFRGT
jgi:hypothetical protein